RAVAVAVGSAVAVQGTVAVAVAVHGAVAVVVRGPVAVAVRGAVAVAVRGAVAIAIAVAVAVHDVCSLVVSHPKIAATVRAIRRRSRPRPDEAHLAPQDVDELGQLVELPATQHPADAGHPGIACRGDERARALARPHRPELQDVEWRAPAPDPGLPEEDRPGPAQPDG